jgi:predicted enzyme related to lactoylglutathione lyase
MGNPVTWFEVVGKDVEAMGRFYGEVFDWNLEDTPMNYKLVNTGGERAAGGIGADPTGGSGHVTFYVEVDDLQATLDKVGSLGGNTLMPPSEVMEGTTIALFADPEGHTVGLL